MRTHSWRALAVAVVGLFAGVEAQTGSLQDLGSLLAGQKNLTTFYSLIKKYPDILLKLPSQSGVTILAPNNDAFDKIPYTQLNAAFENNDQDTIINVLSYHILQGQKMANQLIPGTPVFLPTLLSDAKWSNVTGGQNVENVKQAGDVVVFVSGQGSRATLVQADLSFSGGVVQVIDSLLIPPTNLTSTTTSFNLTSYQGSLYASDQIVNFTDTPNYTLFAPNNAAFQALGSAISSMSVKDLTAVLDFHVLPNQVTFSTALKNGTTWTTKQGGNVTVRHSGNNVFIDSSQLLTTDILLANGVLHVIDNVMNPQGAGAMPNLDLPTQVPAFASASSVANLPFTTAIPCTESCPVTSTSGSGSSTGSANAATRSSSSAFTTSSSSGLGAAMARETGLAGMGRAGLMVALGGAVMMI
ncbi:FAS1 domain-containing protein [Rhexocercosporidium sp. MPI-PUGE-AT-0058]|nr:FAS1 domain-containing protein [Rhexocercosporidium sp. MPI-PUGE-AT-0058]